ncbi:hypothetical protein OAS39_09055 [Pirellulales bacterium]|nr:hypothetical protein [Pirellulales bacterium]
MTKEVQRRSGLKQFPVIVITRDDLEMFFSRKEVARVTDGDMEAIADHFGDRIWEECGISDAFSILKDIAKPFVNR